MGIETGNYINDLDDDWHIPQSEKFDSLTDEYFESPLDDKNIEYLKIRFTTSNNLTKQQYVNLNVSTNTEKDWQYDIWVDSISQDFNIEDELGNITEYSAGQYG